VLLTPSNLAALQTTVRKTYQSAYRDSPDFADKMATMMPSSSATNTYAWMKRLPQLREWFGSRVIENVELHNYTLTNRKFELTVGCPTTDVKDDQLGLFSAKVEMMGRSARYLKTGLILEALLAGTTDTTFDGQAYFSAAHDLNPAGNQSNLGSLALTADNFNTTRATMRSYTGEDGRPLAVNPNLLVIPPQLEKTAREILVAERGDSGSTNIQQGQAEILVVPELTDANDWYVLDTTAPIKPFIYQDREPVTMTTLTNMSDPNVFHLDQFLWGVQGRGAAGYGPWWLAFKNAVA
jgi:phage major head subunit gpT-like protein